MFFKGFYRHIGNKLFLACIFLLFAASCTQPDQQQGSTASEPKSVAVQGYVLPGDSTPEPTIVPAGEPEKIPVTKKVVPLAIHNKHRAGIPKVVPAGKPKINTPGQNGFSMPKSVPAISKPFLP